MKIEKSIKEYAIHGEKYVLVFIILICVYMLSLIGTSLIPSNWMKDNVVKSSEILKTEGEKKCINIGYKDVYMFLFTDALMINTAYSIDSNSPVESALLDRKNYIPGQTLIVHKDQQYNLGASKNYVDAYGNVFQTAELYGLMHGEDITDSYEYARYWHGYLVILRPLLVLTSYKEIRITLLVLMIALVGFMMYLLTKKSNIKIAIIFLLGLFFANVFIATQSFNEIIVFFIAIISSIYLLLKKDVDKNIGINFLVIGSVTAFMDLLTEPLVTLGIPLAVYFLLTEKKNKMIKENIITFIKLCVCWAIGYGLTWATKWIITSIICNRSMIQNAIIQAKYRTENQSISYVKVLERNLSFLSYFIPFISIAIAGTYTIIRLIINRNEKFNIKKNVQIALPYLFIGILPFAWYSVLKQHSMIHSFFTYRILCITVICLFIITEKLTIFEKEKKEEK